MFVCSKLFLNFVTTLSETSTQLLKNPRLLQCGTQDIKDLCKTL